MTIKQITYSLANKSGSLEIYGCNRVDVIRGATRTIFLPDATQCGGQHVYNRTEYRVTAIIAHALVVLSSGRLLYIRCLHIVHMYRQSSLGVQGQIGFAGKILS
jgi:hypothetical protein